jgi:hypothetical protein
MKIGELLIANGLLTPEQLEKALDSQQVYGGKLGTNLVELGLIQETILARFLAQQLHMEAAVPEEFDNIPADALKLVPSDFLQEHKMMPLKLGPKLRMAISDPHDIPAIDQLSFKIGKSIQAVIAPEIWIVAALERYFQVPRPVRFLAVDEGEAFDTFEVTHDMTADPRKLVKRDLETAVKISLEEYCRRLVEAKTSQMIFDALMDYLGPIAPRMAVYVVRKDQISGFMLRGFPVHQREFAEAKIGFGAQSVICRVVETLTSFQGGYQPTADEEKIFGVLKLSPGTKLDLHPIPAFGKTVAAFLGLVADEKGLPKPDAGRLIQLVCEKAGLALEMLSNRQKIMKSPSSV